MPIPAVPSAVPGRGRGRWRAGARTAIAFVSAVAFIATGFAWVTFGRLQEGLSTSDVTSGAGPDGAIDVLLVGLDGRTDAQGNPLPEEVLRELRTGDSGSSLTDTLILLHIPEDRSRAVAYSLPRDSYVSIPDGFGRHKINSAYGRGKAEARKELQAQGVTDPAELERRSNDAGRKLLVRTVEQLTGMSIDHYAEVNLLGFYQLTEAIGGVEVCLNAAVDDPYSGARFPAGRQTISGGDALAFVRQRHGLPRSDFDRVQRQQAFMASLARQVLSAGTLANPAKLADMFDSVQQSVVIDQGWDLLAFAQQMQGLAGGNITFDTIPVEDPEYDTPSDGQAVKVDPRKVQLTIQRLNAGLPAEPPRPKSLDTSIVDVLNGSGVSGLASRVQDELDSEEIPVGDIGNIAAAAASRVLYTPGNDEAARFVAEHLGGLPVQADPKLHSGRIQVLLGADYEGPGAQNLGPAPALRLDGTARQAPATPGGDAITAGGVPCVN
ncbi:transcriptional attenuator, LytR family [Saccharopolyspora shandongensis]|uniref:Transcriptional attenuator, LytR family n=1 Tax=Saccharopolyspora shandongensis TaxID=418495 RepID=A0A1H2ZEH8_9PSEU|nr:LCP family protein [Saccharopolyspora shandongensis]SDX15902.1 transcriptional attenuator, LytR family [Saccharopolyspora shandongensis]